MALAVLSPPRSEGAWPWVLRLRPLGCLPWGAQGQALAPADCPAAGSACPRHHLRRLPKSHMETHACVPVPLGETKLLLGPCMSLLCGVVPMGRAAARPALGPGALGSHPGREVWQGCHSLAAGEAGTGTKECSCCSNKEQ